MSIDIPPSDQGKYLLKDVIHNRFFMLKICQMVAKKKELYTPKVDDFADIYPPEFIKKEKAEVARLKAKWKELEKEKPEWEQKENELIKQASEVLEGVVVDQFSGKWTNEKAIGYYTPDEDDILRKVDIGLEIIGEEGEPNKYLGFGLDVTFSEKPDVLKTKFDNSWLQIAEQKQGELKYFEGEEVRGEIKLFRVVIVIPSSIAAEFLTHYGNVDREKLENHPFHYVILAQIKNQLESYFMANREYGNDEDFHDQLTETVRAFYTIWNSKEGDFDANPKIWEYVENDESYKAVVAACEKRMNNLTAKSK
jgi:hypothetical protein